MKCTAKSSRTGEPCKRPAIRGGNVCATHGGQAPQVKAKARERIQDAADQVAEELVRLALHAESEAVRISAAKDILDRAGLKPTQLIEQDVTVHDGSEVDHEIARLAAEIAGRAEGRTPGGTPVAGNSTA